MSPSGLCPMHTYTDPAHLHKGLEEGRALRLLSPSVPVRRVAAQRPPRSKHSRSTIRRVGMRHVKWAVVVLGFVAAAWGVGAVQGQQLSGEYKIGVLEPLTGNLAAQGKLHPEGYEIMRDLINERFGGVMGKRLVFVTGGAGDPPVAPGAPTRS